MDRMNFAISSYLLLRLMEDEDDSDYEDDDEEDDDDAEEEDQQKRRVEYFRKIAEAKKAANPTSLQGTSVASTSAPRTMVRAPDLVPSVNSSTSLVDPLILPGTSQAECILPTRVETESSSVALVYDPAKVIKKEVEEEIEEFGGESSPIGGEEQISDLNFENVKRILLRLRAEKLVFELEKLKMDRKKVEAEKRNIVLRTKVLELRKKLAGLNSYDESHRPSLPNDRNLDRRLKDRHNLLQVPETVEKDPLSIVVRKVSSPQMKSAVSEGSKRTMTQSILKKSISKKPIQQESSVKVYKMTNPVPRLTDRHNLLQVSETVEKDPLSDSNTVVRNFSSLQRKSTESEGSKRIMTQSILKKVFSTEPIQQESSANVYEMRTTSLVANDDVLSKSSAEDSDILDISEDSLGVIDIKNIDIKNIDINKIELCDESLDCNFESLIAEKERKARCVERQDVPETRERRAVTENLSVHGIDPTGSGGTYVGVDFAGPVAKRKKFSKDPT
ncbi:hypothetical protein C0J52_09976 [Blattella germanica]|nr:hypothetical protein C0J52_09976 [Blattella germanica]